MAALFLTIFTKLLLAKLISGQYQYCSQQPSQYYYPPSYSYPYSPPSYDYSSSNAYYTSNYPAVPTSYSLPAVAETACSLPTAPPNLSPTYSTLPATYPTLAPTYPTLPTTYPTLPPTYPTSTYQPVSSPYPTLPTPVPSPAPPTPPCQCQSASPPPIQKATAYFMSNPVQEPKITVLSNYQGSSVSPPQNSAPCPCAQNPQLPKGCTQNEDIPPSYYCPCCPGCKKLPPPANFNLPPPPMASDVLPGLISQIPPLLPRCEPPSPRSSYESSYSQPCRDISSIGPSTCYNDISAIDVFLTRYGF